MILCIPVYMQASEEMNVIKRMLQQLNRSLGVIARLERWKANVINDAMEEEEKRRDADKGYTVIPNAAARNNGSTDGKIFTTSQGHKIGISAQSMEPIDGYSSTARDKWLKNQQVKISKRPELVKQENFPLLSPVELNKSQESKVKDYYKKIDDFNHDSSMRELSPALLNDEIFPRVKVYQQKTRNFINVCELSAAGSDPLVFGKNTKKVSCKTSDLLKENGRMKQ